HRPSAVQHRSRGDRRGVALPLAAPADRARNEPRIALVWSNKRPGLGSTPGQEPRSLLKVCREVPIETYRDCVLEQVDRPLDRCGRPFGRIARRRPDIARAGVVQLQELAEAAGARLREEPRRAYSDARAAGG